MPPEDAEHQVAAWSAAGRENILTDWVWRPRYHRVEVSTLNFGGRYDQHNVGTVRDFQGMQANGGTPEAREGTRLAMRAHVHIPAPGTSPTTIGELTLGPDNVFDLFAESVRFFDHHLKGIDNGVDEDPSVRLFVMVPPDEGTSGSGFWVTGDSFPLAGTKTQSLFLDSDGNANTSAGDGVLGGGTGDDGDAGSDSFTYHPLDPVPTVGGNLCCRSDLLPPGVFDQATVRVRSSPDWHTRTHSTSGPRPPSSRPATGSGSRSHHRTFRTTPATSTPGASMVRRVPRGRPSRPYSTRSGTLPRLELPVTADVAAAGVMRQIRAQRPFSTTDDFQARFKSLWGVG